MDKTIEFLRIIESIGGSPTCAISWMEELIRLGTDYVTNGPARPAEDDTDAKESKPYAIIALKLLVADLESQWKAEKQ